MMKLHDMGDAFGPGSTLQPSVSDPIPIAAAAEGDALTDEQIDSVARAMLYQPWGIGSRIQDARAFARAILAAKPKAAEAHGWQPIETAPKDGSVILYWVRAVRYEEDEGTGDVREIDVSAPDFGCWNAGIDGNGWHDPFSGTPGDHGGPTHWMPSPPAPGSDVQPKE